MIPQKEKFIICDIDGTLSDCSHRRHWVEGPGKKNFEKFYSECFADPVHWDIANLIIGQVNPVIYCSGRPEKWRKVTLDWLTHHGMPKGELLMRKDGDNREDYIIKEELTAFLTPADVWFILDDRDQVVRMWRGRGFRCLQVADGNF